MRQGFDVAAEERQLADYLQTLPSGYVCGSVSASREADRIRRTCDEFREIHSGESLLDHAQSTSGILSWSEHIGTRIAATDCVSRIAAIGRWWAWLFDHKRLDHNVLACFHPCSRVLSELPLTLHHNLQQPIAQYLEERGTQGRATQRKATRLLNNFNVFVHRIRPTAEQLCIDEEVALEWIHHLGRTWSLHGLSLMTGWTCRFLDYLVDTGHLASNPLAELRSRYDVKDRKELLTGLCSEGEIVLRPARAAPRFVSPLGRHLEAFVALKRAMGHRYIGPEKDLRRFDRFVSRLHPDVDVVTKEIVHAWLEAGRALHPRTRKRRLGLVRQLCLYLVRLDSRTYVPDRRLAPARIPEFKAYIYSSDEIRALLQAALAMPAGRDPLRPKTIYTILLILYATGLRISEALGLRLQDVDLHTGTLLVRETKFFKSRILPIPSNLGEAIADYLRVRLIAAPSPKSFLFRNYFGRPYAVDKFASRFHELLQAAGIPRRPAHRRPRVHDIRHTFATANLLRWYQAGIDVQAKLPMLATYMGHASVLSTQDYLRAIPDLLQEASYRFERTYGSLLTATRDDVDAT